jgi:hypothetical protein
MSKLQLAQKVCGLPTVETVVHPTAEVSKTKARKLAKSAAYAKHVKKIKHGIALKVEAMATEEVRLRLQEVISIVKGINADLLLYAKGIINIPKMIESGLPPKAWEERARQALKYELLERKLLLIKLQTTTMTETSEETK